jgi:hypothetical protein
MAVRFLHGRGSNLFCLVSLGPAVILSLSLAMISFKKRGARVNRQAPKAIYTYRSLQLLVLLKSVLACLQVKKKMAIGCL